jgi:hypothetical protein
MSPIAARPHGRVSSFRPGPQKFCHRLSESRAPVRPGYGRHENIDMIHALFRRLFHDIVRSRGRTADAAMMGRVVLGKVMGA